MMNAHSPYQAYHPHYVAPPSISTPATFAPATSTPATCTSATAPDVPSALCCALVQSHRAINTHWEFQVNAFMAWLVNNGKSRLATALPDGCELVLRLSTTITYGRDCGALEYAAVRTQVGGGVQYAFVSVPLNTGTANGFTDLCAFKNYNCPGHKLNFHLDLHRRP